MPLPLGSGKQRAKIMTEQVQTQETPEAVPENTPVATLRAIARVKGEDVTQVPHDLYIPPDALQVFLETFEGPLDFCFT